MKNLEFECWERNQPVKPGELIFSPQEIQEKVKELAGEISRDYQGKEILLIGILKSSVFFLADLIRSISIPLTLDFIATAKYPANKHSGIVKIVKDLEENLYSKEVLLVRTIVDSGTSLSYLISNLKLRKPAGIKVCSLLLRKASLKNQLKIDYLGFSVGEKFLVGYGMDYKEAFRNLPYIAELSVKNRKKETL